MRQAPQSLDLGGPLPPQRVIYGISIGLNRALKISQPFLRTFPPSAGAELQKHVALGVGVKPQVASGRFAFNFRIEHLDGRFIDLQVAGGLEFLPNAVVNGQQQKGDLLHPLHHLLTGNVDPVSLSEYPLQGVISDVVVKTA